MEVGLVASHEPVSHAASLFNGDGCRARCCDICPEVSWQPHEACWTPTCTPAVSGGGEGLALIADALWRVANSLLHSGLQPARDGARPPGTPLAVTHQGWFGF